MDINKELIKMKSIVSRVKEYLGEGMSHTVGMAMLSDRVVVVLDKYEGEIEADIFYDPTFYSCMGQPDTLNREKGAELACVYGASFSSHPSNYENAAFSARRFLTPKGATAEFYNEPVEIKLR